MPARSEADARLHSVPGDHRLDGWKEIAACLEKDVTTIQRWEKREGLPIHRHQHERLGTVYAFTGELRAWLESRRQSGGGDHIAENGDTAPDRDEPSPTRHWIWFAALALAAASAGAVAWWSFVRTSPSASPSAPRTLVVLPCRPIEGHESDRAYCDGVTDILIGRLTPLAGERHLLIVPASEIRRSGVKTTADARRLLNASLAIEGVLQRSGDRVQVTWSLVDAEKRAQVDAFTHTAPAADLFDLQDRVAAWAARAVGLEGAPMRKATTDRGTTNPRAYEMYVQGRGYLLEYQRPGAVDTAIGLFTKAVEEDPEFAFAHAGLGLAHLRHFELTRSPDRIPLAETSCAEAYRLQPGAAAVEMCRGALANAQGRYEEAIQAFELALADDPASDEAYLGLAQAQEASGAIAAAEGTYRKAIDVRPGYWAAHMWLGRFYRGQHRYDEAIAEYERAAMLTPDNGQAQVLLGGLYMLVGRLADALQSYDRALALGEPLAHNARGMTYFRMRRIPEAVASLEQAVAATRDVQSVGNLARARYWNGERVAARQLFEEAVRLGEEELRINPLNRDARLLVADYRAKLGQREQAIADLALASIPDADPHLLWFAAVIHNQLGDRRMTLAYLGRAVQNGLPSSELENWLEFDGLRGQPAFQALLSQSKATSRSQAGPRR